MGVIGLLWADFKCCKFMKPTPLSPQEATFNNRVLPFCRTLPCCRPKDEPKNDLDPNQLQNESDLEPIIRDAKLRATMSLDDINNPESNSGTSGDLLYHFDNWMQPKTDKTKIALGLSSKRELPRAECQGPSAHLPLPNALEQKNDTFKTGKNHPFLSLFALN